MIVRQCVYAQGQRPGKLFFSYIQENIIVLHNILHFCIDTSQGQRHRTIFLLHIIISVQNITLFLKKAYILERRSKKNLTVGIHPK
jgi:hypothetical protein